VENVSDPQRKMGFDLRSVRPDGTVRYIEFKGRARVGDLELTPNEWAQANNQRQILAVRRVQLRDNAHAQAHPDPVGQGIGRPKGGVMIDADDLLDLPGECD
jgi:hypothetical protein